MFCILRGLALPALLILSCFASMSTAEEDKNMKPIFSKGELGDKGEYKIRDDDKDPKQKKKTAKVAQSRLAHAVKYHCKNLKDADPDVRLSSCEMLGVLG